MQRKRSIAGYLGLAFILLAARPAAAATEAGEAVLARGAATAQLQGQSARILGPGSVIYEGDVVTTTKRSVTVLKLQDGTRVTVRPESSFQVESFNAARNQESAVMRLFRGGLRAVTGFISKRNPNAMRLHTAVATIGIRGTEFDARLCGEDCAQEAKARPVPAGRAAFVRGNVVARTVGGRTRTLNTSDAVYNGDSIVTGAGAYTVIAFRDQSRITVLPDTEFQVQRLDYVESAPEKSRAIMKLLRGGLRAVSGLIGKQRRRNYSLNTPVATIGIRGTGFDLLCQGTCVNPSTDQNPGGDGLFVEVWEGSIVFDGQYETGAGQAVFLSNLLTPPVVVPSIPIMNVPRPDQVPIPETPPAPSSSAPDEGLYVSCFAGNCAVETPQNVVDLQAGEASFVGAAGGAAQELAEIPPFQAEDPLYHALEFGEVLNLLNESIEGGGFECTVP